MSNSNTVKRQVGGNIVGTLAPIVNPGTNQTLFTFNVGPLGSVTLPGSGPIPTNTGYLVGGVIPLAAGTPSDLTPTGLGTDYQGNAVANAPKFQEIYAGSGQVLHIAATGTFAGLTANSTTISLALFEVPAAILPIASTITTGFGLIAAGGNEVTVTSAEEVTATSGVFTFDVFIQLDAAGNLNGYYQAQIGGTVIANTAISGTVTGLVGEADLNFVLAATLGTSAPSTAMLTVDEFRIDLE